MKSKSSFLTVALEAVKKAEEVILHYYSPDIKTALKSDASPVTLADQESEKIIIKTIKKAFPNHGFLGEEFGSQTENSEYVWIIDPIDGTKNYIRTIPIFATQLALMKNDEVIVGVSNAPILNELLYAEKGQGAYCNDHKISVSKLDSLENAFLSFGGVNNFADRNQFDAFLKLCDKVSGRRAFGDFWNFHLLAQGKIDIVIEPKAQIWDIAALTCILREAGGVIVDLEGNPITKNSTSAIATNGHLHQEVLKFLAP